MWLEEEEWVVAAAPLEAAEVGVLGLHVEAQPWHRKSHLRRGIHLAALEDVGVRS